ncbi:MAG TPA: sigma-70 family RNA polymerase sigma factor [Solirubrobacteraceae bacterium]
MEATALTHSSIPGLSRPSPLLRLQSDEKLVALTRRGQHAAFETLFSRYQSRLLSFCRHMLSSREDAEDVLQEVFTAAFNAILADEREINVRPWLYRIARNRSLNHLRRASAVGVDSMDIHFAEGGISTGEKVIRRESFRLLIGDVQQLPETQRTALLLREIDALSYEQIAHAMETTVPSVKSLLVRARISLAEAAEARKLSCEEVRLELGAVAEGLIKLGSPARRHVRDCERCHAFKKHLKANNHALAAIFPVGPLLLFKKLLLTKLGSTASAGSAHVAGGAGATAGATAAAGAASAGGASTAGGLLTAGAGALATKAVAGLAAAALVTAGAVATQHNGNATHRHRHITSASTVGVSAGGPTAEPVVVRDRAQPISSAAGAVVSVAAVTHRTAKRNATAKAVGPAVSPATVTPSTAHPAPVVEALPPAKPVTPPVTEVTTETTELPAAATAQPQPTTPAAPVATPVPSEAPQPAAPAAENEEPAAASTTPPAEEAPAIAPVPTQPQGAGAPGAVEPSGGTPAPPSGD